jgi:Concanavalin A-like lectin/glucanases superfamily
LEYDIAGTPGNGSWGHISGTCDKHAGPGNQRLCLNGARVAHMSDTLPIVLNSVALGTGRHVSGIADPFNGHVDEFRISHVQRSDGWIETTWNNMSDPGAFAAAGVEEQEGGDGEPPPLAGAGVVVCLMGVRRTFGADRGRNRRWPCAPTRLR